MRSCHRAVASVVVLGAVITFAGAGAGGAAWAVAKPRAALFLRVQNAVRTVDLTLIVADTTANNGFNFDGYGRGELAVRVPRGWRVRVTVRNAGPRFDSCAVVTGPGATSVAFPGASTPSPLRGLAPGAAASFSFLAARVGVFRFASLVPGHEQARMWDVLVVGNGGQPSISARPGP